MTALSILIVGLLLGMKHATEADHLAAVATLVTRQNSLGQTLRQGVAWGIGHTLTLMFFAGAVLALGQAISPNLEKALETAVGVMLVLLGADVLRRLLRDRIHFHIHRHDPDTQHVHAHSHRGEGADQSTSAFGSGASLLGAARRGAHRSTSAFGSDASLLGAARRGAHAASPHRHAHARRWPLRALLVGMMHGLAGSAALVVLSLQQVPSVALGLGYIALFGVGSIVGMAALSVVISVPLKLSAAYLTGMHHAMTAMVGVFTCGLGVYIIVELGYLKALLLA